MEIWTHLLYQSPKKNQHIDSRQTHISPTTVAFDPLQLQPPVTLSCDRFSSSIQPKQPTPLPPTFNYPPGNASSPDPPGRDMHNALARIARQFLTPSVLTTVARNSVFDLFSRVFSLSASRAIETALCEGRRAHSSEDKKLGSKRLFFSRSAISARVYHKLPRLAGFPEMDFSPRAAGGNRRRGRGVCVCSIVARERFLDIRFGWVSGERREEGREILLVDIFH